MSEFFSEVSMELKTLHKIQGTNTKVIACASLEAGATIKTLEEGN